MKNWDKHLQRNALQTIPVQRANLCDRFLIFYRL